MKAEQKGIKRILKAFSYSFDGFRAAFKSEASFRQDLFFCLIFGISIFFLPFSPTQSALAFFSLFFILFAELTNTAIETIVDRFGEEYDELSKKAKDIGSLLVFLAFLNLFIIWGTLLCEAFF